MILLYKYDNTLIHIQRKGESTTPVSDLQSTLFLKHMKNIGYNK